jgi:DNA mismatch endonuclease (patch repair protein)
MRNITLYPLGIDPRRYPQSHPEYKLISWKFAFAQYKAGTGSQSIKGQRHIKGADLLSPGAWRNMESMVDIETTQAKAEARSRIMRGVRKKNTKPERIVRRQLHAMGFRFRLHRRDLPGTPDVVMPRHSAVVLVHGCFWHQHAGCKHANQPRNRTDYWLPKLARNVERDAEAKKALVALGWRVLVLWECELRDDVVLRERLQAFIQPQ